MGYITNYELSVEDRLVENRDIEFDVSQAISNFLSFSQGARYALDEDGGTREGCKWYEHDDDLKNFSKQPEYKDVLFTLSGTGEEGGDLWKLYVMNGKAQLAKAKMTYDAFDEKLLKS